MAIKVVFQTPDMNYSKAVDMLEAGHADDARRARAAENIARNVLRSVRCVKHDKQDLYVIVLFEASGHIRAYVKSCCGAATKDAQGVLDVEVNPDDAEWRQHS